MRKLSSTEWRLTEDEFELRFPLRKNHITRRQASWSYDEGWGCLFETYGRELEFVKAQPADRIWTWVENGRGNGTTVCSGFHFVNRIGYFISKTPVPNGKTFLVPIR